MKKKLMVTLIIVIAIVIAIVVASNKKVTIVSGETEVSFKYSSMNFKYTENSNTEGILESKNEEIKFKVNDNLKESYESYSILKDYRMMAYNGQEVEYNTIPCFYYYDTIENRYVIISQIDEEKYLGIYISPKEDSDKSAEETFNQNTVQKVLKTLEIKS